MTLQGPSQVQPLPDRRHDMDSLSHCARLNSYVCTTKACGFYSGIGNGALYAAVVATSPHLDHLVLSVCREYMTAVRQLYQDQTCNEKPLLNPFDKPQDGRSHLPGFVKAEDRTRSRMQVVSTCRHAVCTATPQYHTSIQNSAPATQPHQRKGNRGQ